MDFLKGFSTFPAKPSRADGTLVLKTRRNEAGMSLLEVTIAIAVLGLFVVTAMACLTILNKHALAGRVMSSARELAQSKIEQTVGVPFSSSNVPAVLATGTTTETGTIYKSRNGTDSLTGTLTRTVTSVNTTVRAITVRVDYTFQGKNLTYEMTTMRAMDK